MSYNKTTWASGQKITANLLNHIENGIEGLENKVGYDLILTSSYDDFMSPSSQDSFDFISITKGNLKNFITSLKNNQYPRAILVLTKVQQQDLHSSGVEEYKTVYYFPFTYYQQYTWLETDEDIHQYYFLLNFAEYLVIKCDENGNIIGIDS